MNKIEKIAEAIYMQRNGYGCKAWSRLTNAHKQPYLDDAKAALSVIAQECRNELTEG